MNGLAALSTFSATIGRDPAQIQGPGGNTSLKQGDTLWVKASGLWLAEADRHPSFVALDLPALRARLASAVADPPLADLVTQSPPGMRPSIETVLHAAMSHPVVVHTHSVNALAFLVRTDAQGQLAPRLSGLRWSFIPYARPGLPLLNAVQATQGATEADVLMLQNHGLVVAAATIPAAEALLAEVERRLATPPRPASPPSIQALETLAATTPWRPARFAISRALATDPACHAPLAAGSLYPDHVVFLGPAPVPVLSPAATPPWLARHPTAKLLVVEGTGVLVPPDTSAEAEEMIRCLALVLLRLPPGAPLHPLDREAEAALLGWDAEKFRQALTRPGQAPA